MNTADQLDVALLSATEKAGEVAHLLVAFLVRHSGKLIGHVIPSLMFSCGYAVLQGGKRGVAFGLGERNGLASLDGDDVPELLP